jgi:hypothetical protein
MTKSTFKIALLAAAGSLFASAAWAGPVSLTDAQMDTIAAGGVETTTGFVCPVIVQDGITNAQPSENNTVVVIGAAIGEGHYTVIPLDDGAHRELTIPVDATNGDGAGTPGGSHSEPGDTNYTAIWAYN